MQLIDVFTALALLATLTLAGYLLRLKVMFLQRYAVPTSIVAGLIALLLGPQLLGKAIPLLPQKTPEIWADFSLGTICGWTDPCVDFIDAHSGN